MRRLILATAATLALGSMAFAQTATNVETEVFVTAKPTDVISSNILNLDITNSKDESIGKIQDLIISEGALTGYIVSGWRVPRHRRKICDRRATIRRNPLCGKRQEVVGQDGHHQGSFGKGSGIQI